jgi:hypothetical protein
MARQTNMQKGFVITSVNNETVYTVDDLQKAMSANSDNVQMMGFYPGVQGMYYYGLNNIGQNLQNEE